MKHANYLILSIIIVLFGSSESLGQTNSCSKIEFTAVAVKDLGQASTIKVDLKGKEKDQFIINFIKPRGEFLLDTKKLEFNNLDKGEYVVVVTGRKENDNYCPSYSKIEIE